MMPAASLSVESLTVTYGKLCALDCVDLGAGPGATALLGPNGAGKSTLIRWLATVQAPDSGVIRFNGLGLTGRSELREYRRHLGYMPQSPGAYPSWTLMGFLSYIAELKEIPRPRIRSECERVLDLVDLSDRRKHRARSLSGGMRHRLGLACALLGSPDLIILDEPTTGLDPEQRMQFRRVIAREAAHACVLICTHLTEEVTAFCSRVLVLDHGRFLFDGTPAELTARADGRTWLAPGVDPDSWAAWDVSGGVRQVCPTRPAQGVPLTPTIDDGYLATLHDRKDRRAA